MIDLSDHQGEGREARGEDRQVHEQQPVDEHGEHTEHGVPIYTHIYI